MNKETNTIISNLEGCSDMFDYCLTPKARLVLDIKELQQENKQLKKDIKNITKILGLDENTLFDDVKAYVRGLKDNWNKLKEIMEEETREYWNTNILEIMQKIEQGSDNNVKD